MPNASTTEDSLELTLDVAREARVSDAMTAMLRVRNVAGRPIDLYLRGRTMTVDVVAARPEGQVVWRRLEGEMIPAVIQHRRLDTGETLDVPVSWSWRLEGGDYRLQALLLTESEPLASERVSLLLRP